MSQQLTGITDPITKRPYHPLLLDAKFWKEEFDINVNSIFGAKSYQMVCYVQHIQFLIVPFCVCLCVCVCECDFLFANGFTICFSGVGEVRDEQKKGRLIPFREPWAKKPKKKCVV